jgi:hypothetical protein
MPSETTVPEPKVTPVTTSSQPSPGASSHRSDDKRKEALRANKIRKRAAHRVALRRSHTGG